MRRALFVVQYKHLLWPPSMEWLHFVLRRLWHVTQAMVVFGQYQMREEFQHILRREVTPLNNTRATYNRYDISSQVCMVVLSFVMCCYYRTYIGACVS